MNNLNVLIATDFSAASVAAEKYAIDFAASTNASLTFLHVYHFSAAATRGTATDMVKAKLDMHNTKLEELESHCRKLITEAGPKAETVTYQCLVRPGKIGKSITNETDNADAELIFMGTHADRTFMETIFGGHTWEMVKKRNVPILAIPADVEFHEPRKIVFAVQGREGEIPALKFLTFLAQKFDADITLLHVTDFVHTPQAADEIFKKFLRDVDKEIGYEKKITRFRHATSVSKGITAFCESVNADWLTMCHEQTGLLERIFMPDTSLTKKLIFNTGIPLLCRPDYYDPRYNRLWKIFEPNAEELHDEF